MALKFKKLSGGEAARIYQKGEIKGVPNNGYLEEFNFNYHLTPAEIDQILRDANLPFNEFLAAQGMPLYSVFGIGAEQNGEAIHTSPYLSFDIVDLGIMINAMAGSELFAPNQYFIVGWNLFASSFGGDNRVFMLYASELPNGFNLQLGMPAGWQQDQLDAFFEFWASSGENIVNDTYFNLANQQEFKFILFENTDLGGLIYEIGQANNTICPLINWKYIEGYEVNLSGTYVPTKIQVKSQEEDVIIKTKDYLDVKEMPVEIRVQSSVDQRAYQLIANHTTDHFNNYISSFETPSTIYEIRPHAFEEAKFFRNINLTIDQKLLSIGDCAFKDCTNATFQLPDSIMWIRKNAFENCRAITDFNAPTCLAYVEEGAFKGCNSLKSFNAQYAMDFENNVFQNCSSLQNFDLNLIAGTYIPSYMFAGTRITPTTVPNRISSLQTGCFSSTPITNFTLPERSSDFWLYSEVFKGCSSLVSFDASNVESISGFGSDNYSEYNSLSENLFENCSKLETFIPPKKKIQYIGRSTFKGCKALTTFPENEVSHIDESAFEGCSKLTSFNSEYLEIIGTEAFRGCASLSNLNIPNIKGIGEYAFYGCTQLTGFDVKNLTKIPDYVFYSCINLNNIDFSSIKEVGQYAFYDCTNLSNVDFSNIKEIGQCAFNGCKNITRINSENEGEGVIDDKFPITGDSAFGRTGIKNIIVNKTNLNNYRIPFSGLASLTIKAPEGIQIEIPSDFARRSLGGSSTITVEEGIKSIKKAAFGPNTSSSWTGNKIYLPKTLEQLESYFIDLYSSQQSISVYYAGSFKDWCNKFMGVKPSEGDTDEGGSCYLYCFDEGLNDYTNNFIFDESIEHVSDEAFADVNLGSVEFANPNTTIGTYAFARNDIQSFKFPMNLQEIPEGVLKYCHHLDVVEFPTAPTKIGKHAFYNSSEWGSTLDARWSDNIIIPSTVKEIGDGAFYKCSAKAIELPEGLEIIGAEAFMSNGITSWTGFPSTVIKVGAEAFNGNGLTILNIGPALTEIEDLALVFNKWETITVDENNPVYDSRDNCNSIIETATNKLITGSKNTIIPDGVVEIGDYSIGKTNIEQIIIPDSVTTIGQGAFKDCAKLTSITLPSHIKELKYRTLYNCDLLTTFEFPEDLEVIYSESLANCAKLTSVHINDKLKTIAKQTEESSTYVPFYQTTSLTTLYLSKNFSKIIGENSNSYYEGKLFNFSKDSSTTSNIPTINTLYYKGTQEELNQLTKSQVAILHRVDSVYVLNGEEYVLTTNLPTIENAPEDLPEPEEPDTPSTIPEKILRITTDTTETNFNSRNDITTIVIEEGVESIEYYTFNYCHNLTKLYIPSTLKEFCMNGIRSSNMQEVYYNGTLTDLLNSSLRFNFPYNDKELSIDYYVLNDSGEYIKLENQITINLDDISLPHSEKYFPHCNKITSIKITGTPKKINNTLFDASSIKEIYVDSLEQYFLLEAGVGSYNTVKDLFVWNEETSEYEKVIDLIMPSNYSFRWGYSLYGLSIETIEFPENFDLDGSYVLENCPNIKEIKFKEGWQGSTGVYLEIDSITDHKIVVDLPSTTSYIRGNSFCPNNSNIIWVVRSYRPPVITSGMGEISVSRGLLYVPDEAAKYYLNTPGWSSEPPRPLTEWEQNKEEILNSVE